MIRTVVTRGYGNGTFNGTIADVVRRGYIAGVAIAVVSQNRMLSARHVRRRIYRSR